MKSRSLYIVFLLILSSMLCMAELPKIISVKQFDGLYPASHSLLIPFHGCVELEGELPKQGGEYWLPLGHILEDADFAKIELLVNSDRTILGARAKFKGSIEEWSGERGYKSRKRVLLVFSGGDGPELSKEIPLAFDGRGFGEMVYTFDTLGHVSWRKPQSHLPMTEKEYVESREKHKREYNEEGCRNLTTDASVVLRLKK